LGTPFLRRKGFEIQCVNLDTNKLPQCTVDHLVPAEASLTVKRSANDNRLIVSGTVSFHINAGI